jgi:hypothetical protein
VVVLLVFSPFNYGLASHAWATGWQESAELACCGQARGYCEPLNCEIYIFMHFQALLRVGLRCCVKDCRHNFVKAGCAAAAPNKRYAARNRNIACCAVSIYGFQN